MTSEVRKNQNLDAVMKLIINGGNARKTALAAIKAAEANDFVTAKQKLASARASLKTAHEQETSLLTAEASGEKVKLSLLMIHAQDHMMNADTVADLATQMVTMYEKFHQLEQKVADDKA